VFARVLLINLFRSGLTSQIPNEFYLGSKVDAISMELKAITPTCEITRTPRSLTDVKEWKGKKFIISIIQHGVKSFF